MVAGLATLKTLLRENPYAMLDSHAARLCQGIAAAAEATRIPIWQSRVGSMFTTFFTSEPVSDYASAKKSDTVRYAKFFHTMLDAGIYFAPSQFEAGFVSIAHTDLALEQIVATLRHVFEDHRRSNPESTASG